MTQLNGQMRLSPAQGAAFSRAHMGMLAELNSQLASAGKFAIGNSEQTYQRSAGRKRSVSLRPLVLRHERNCCLRCADEMLPGIGATTMMIEDFAGTVRHCIYLVFSLSSSPRHCLCLCFRCLRC